MSSFSSPEDAFFFNAYSPKNSSSIDANTVARENLAPFVQGDSAWDVYMIRNNGRYGIFVPDRYAGLGTYTVAYIGEHEPYPFEDVRICVSDMLYWYGGYVAAKQNGMWHVVYVFDHGWLPITRERDSFDMAISSLDHMLGFEPNFKWMTFEEYMKHLHR